MSDRAVVLDSSALLALLFDEPGAEVVADALPRAAVSTVNWVEVHQHAHRHGDIAGAREALGKAGLKLVPLSLRDAETAASLREPTRHLGLSLADRCCLALALGSGLPALTADGVWSQADVGAHIVAIR